MSINYSYNEKDLVSRIVEGNQRAFTEVFNTYYDRIYQLAYVYCHDTELARDTTQMIFMSLWERRENLAAIGNIEAWLFGAAKFQVWRLMKNQASEIQKRQAFDIENKVLITPADKLIEKQQFELNEPVPYCIEYNPKALPSVSKQIEQKPNSPIENFGLCTLPPAASTLLSSTLQSLQGKYTMVLTQAPSPSFVPGISINAPLTNSPSSTGGGEHRHLHISRITGTFRHVAKLGTQHCTVKLFSSFNFFYINLKPADYILIHDNDDFVNKKRLITIVRKFLLAYSVPEETCPQNSRSLNLLHLHLQQLM